MKPTASSMNHKVFGKFPALAAAAHALGILFASLTIATAQQEASNLDKLRIYHRALSVEAVAEIFQKQS